MQVTESYPFWFACLSLFGGLLGCSAASAHRLCSTRPAKWLVTIGALAATVTALAGGVTLIGFVLPQVAFSLSDQSGNEPLKILLRFYTALATWTMGYFSLAAYGVGLALCALLQRAGRRRLPPTRLPTPTS